MGRAQKSFAVHKAAAMKTTQVAPPPPSPDNMGSFEEERARFEKSERYVTLRLVRLLDRYDPRDKQNFSYLVKHAIAASDDQSEIAEQLGVSQSTISRWASGAVTPPQPARAGAMMVLRNDLLKKADLAGVVTDVIESEFEELRQELASG